MHWALGRNQPLGSAQSEGIIKILSWHSQIDTPPPSQVSSAALEALRAVIKACPRALDTAALERLMPPVFQVWDRGGCGSDLEGCRSHHFKIPYLQSFLPFQMPCLLPQRTADPRDATRVLAFGILQGVVHVGRDVHSIYVRGHQFLCG